MIIEIKTHLIYLKANEFYTKAFDQTNWLAFFITLSKTKISKQDKKENPSIATFVFHIKIIIKKINY